MIMVQLTGFVFWTFCLTSLIGTTSSQTLGNTRTPSLWSGSPAVGSNNDPPGPDTKTLTNGITVLILPTVEEFEQVAEECHEYLSKPMVFNDEDSLKDFSAALDDMHYSGDDAFWVGINGFTPQLFTSKCYPLANYRDRCLCFKDYWELRPKFPDCKIEDGVAGVISWNPDDDKCPGDEFRPVCENGLSCSENSQGMCGAWLIGCPLHGQCVEVDDVSPGALVTTCRFPPPTIRLIHSGANHFNLSCQIHDECLRNSYTSNEWSARKNNLYVKYFQNEILLTSYPNTDPFKIVAAIWELNSGFQCRYTYMGVSSSMSNSVHRPMVESDKTNVQLGDHVSLTCSDPGVQHLLEEPVTFQWETPNNPSLETPVETMTIDSFSQNDAGNYKCRSVVDSLPSVWSKPEVITVAVEVPVLTASDLDVSYGSAVNLLCSTKNLPASFRYVFAKNGDHLQEDGVLHEYFITKFSFGDVGEYECWLESKGLIVGPSNKVNLEMKQVLAPSLISDQGETVRGGRRVTLNCQRVMSYKETVEYSFSFQNLMENTTVELTVGPASEYIIPSFTAGEEGAYSCYINVIDGNANPRATLQTSNSSNTVTLRMISAILQSTATTVPEGSDIQLTCNITNYIGTVQQYSWFKTDLNPAIATTTAENSMTIRNFQTEHGGIYTCQAFLTDPSLRDPPLVSLNVKLVAAPRYQKCPCECSPQTLALPPATPTVIEESKQAIEKNLSVKKAELSFNVRRVSSAPDDRPVSVSAGYTAVALLSLVAVLVLIPDTISVVMFFIQIYKGEDGESTVTALKKSIESWVFPKSKAAQDSE